MNFYWSLRNVPELRDLAAQDRTAVWRDAYFRTFRHWQAWGAVAFLFVLAIALCSAAEALGAGVIGVGIAGGIAGFLYAGIAMSLARPHMREMLDRKPR